MLKPSTFFAILCFFALQTKAQKYTDQDLIGTWETTVKRGNSNCKMTYIFNENTSLATVNCSDGTTNDNISSKWKYYPDIEVLHQIIDGKDYKGQIKWINKDSMIYTNFENLYNFADRNYYKRISQKGIAKNTRNNEKKEYFNDKWKPCTQNGASYYRLITYSAPNIPIGTIKDYYINGTIQSEFKANYIDPQDEANYKYIGDAYFYDSNGKYIQRVHYSDNSELLYFVQCDVNQIEAAKYEKNPNANDELTYHYFIMFPEKYPGEITDEFKISDLVAEKLKEKGLEQIYNTNIAPNENNEKYCKTLFVFPHHEWDIGGADGLTLTIKNCEGKEVFRGDKAAMSLSHEGEARKLVRKVSKDFSSIPSSMKMPYFITRLNGSSQPAQTTTKTINKPSISTTEIEYHNCSNCSGLGKVKCNLCNGEGKTMCYMCSGLGRTNKLVNKQVQYYDDISKSYKYKYEYVYDYQNCNICNGSGKQRCNKCYESGKIDCYKCTGSGKESSIVHKKVQE